MEGEAIAKNRVLNISQHTFRRSELAKLSESDLPQQPMELLVVAHKISGQRNPLTDQHGLYNNLLKHSWDRADVVLICLFDVPPSYFAQLLAEQPTLRGMLSAGRLLPLFCNEDAGREENGDAEMEAAVGETEKTAESKLHEEAEAAWWLVRCLDGRVPLYEGLPTDNGKTDEVIAAVAGTAQSRGKGAELQADPRKQRLQGGSEVEVG